MADLDEADLSALTRTERAALRLGMLVNDRPGAKAAQTRYLKAFSYRWMSLCIKNLLHVRGGEHVDALAPERGVLLVANHRSFFDQYVINCALTQRVSWVERMYFPVRANFFYESAAGVFVNLFMGGGSMYPPIYRDPKKAELNKAAVEKVAEILAQPRVVVGMHPEGTRGKGPDPYELLPAQPGVGQMIMRSRPVVLPVFVNGLVNDLAEQVISNFRTGEKKGQPICVVFGPPVDFGKLLDGTPRPAQYKRVADRTMAVVKDLGEQERAFRAELMAARR